jgi:hypothetical protein
VRPDEARDRILNAELVQVDQWIARVADVETLDEFFA